MQSESVPSLERSQGFTLIELLVAIAIMSLLFSIVLASVQNVRRRGRDSERIQTLNSFQTALELYHNDYGRYPSRDADGVGYLGFTYQLRDASGECVINDPDLGFDNSASPGLLLELFELGYTTVGYWVDPLNPEAGSSYNCRYVVPGAEQRVDNIQHYLLHCNLEVQLDFERQDGGTNDTLYEIMEGGPWICVDDTYD